MKEIEFEALNQIMKDLDSVCISKRLYFTQQIEMFLQVYEHVVLILAFSFFIFLKTPPPMSHYQLVTGTLHILHRNGRFKIYSFRVPRGLSISILRALRFLIEIDC